MNSDHVTGMGQGPCRRKTAVSRRSSQTVLSQLAMLTRRSHGAKMPELIVVIRAKTLTTTFDELRPLMKLLVMNSGEGVPRCSPLKSRHFSTGLRFCCIVFGVCASSEEHRKSLMLWEMTSETHSVLAWFDSGYKSHVNKWNLWRNFPYFST